MRAIKMMTAQECAIRACVTSFTDEEKLVVSLHYAYELSLAEVAAVLDMQEEEVDSILCAIRQRLHACQ